MSISLKIQKMIAAILVFVFGFGMPVSSGLAQAEKAFKQPLANLGRNLPISPSYLTENENSQVVSGVLMRQDTQECVVFDTTSLYTVTDLGSLGGDYTRPFDINNLGQVVGRTASGNENNTHAFLWQDGGPMIDLGSGNSDGAIATNINDLGIIVGFDSNPNVAVIWDENLNRTSIGTLGGDDYSWGSGINNLNQVVGESSTNEGLYRQFLWDESASIVDLGMLNDGHSVFGIKINDAGQISGTLGIIGSYNPVLYAFIRQRDGRIVNITEGTALGINQKGQVVGGIGNLSDGLSAFIWEEGSQLRNLGTVNGYDGSEAVDINDLGQVVGLLYEIDGNRDGLRSDSTFLWNDGQMYDLNELIPANSGWNLIEAIGINNNGQIIGVGEYNGQRRGYLLTPSPRPVLIVPGAGGTYFETVQPGLDRIWALNRGLPPERLQIDPLARAYDDLIKTLECAGYVRDRNLFIVNYDWRLLPGPIDGVYDGYINGLTAANISDTEYLYGVDYLGVFLKRAAEVWENNYPGFPLTSVDVITHSTGGLVTRTYVQSNAYGGMYTPGQGDKRLPKIENFIMIGVPNRGASKPWNPLHDKWLIDRVMFVVFRSIINHSYVKALDGNIINGPDHNITLDSIADNNKQRQRMRFIQLFMPTLRSLLATYDFMDYGDGNLVDVNQDPEWRNELILDLNHGLDLELTGDPNAFADLANVTIIYGDGVKTPETVKRVRLPRVPGLPEYFDRDMNPATGDGTVPSISAIGQFVKDGKVDNRVTILPFTKDNTSGKTDHLGLLRNIDVQTQVLRLLGRNTNSPISTNTGKNYENVRLVVFFDPVEGFIIDGDGRRLGYSAETGPVTEIPGSVWLGKTDGSGWIFAPVKEPISLQLIGLGENYNVAVNVDTPNQQGGIELSGFLEVGETLTQAIPLELKTMGVYVDKANAQPNPTDATPINYSVTFSEPIDVFTFAPDDITVESSADDLLGITISEVDPFDGTVFNVAVSGMRNTGTVDISLDTGRVLSANGLENSVSIGNDTAVTYTSTNTVTPTTTESSAIPTSTPTAPPASTTSDSNLMIYIFVILAVLIVVVVILRRNR